MVTYFIFWSDLRQYLSIQAYQPYIVTHKNEITNFQRYLSLYIFKKKYFCGRPHEIYFRHPVRRKQSYIFFWPKGGFLLWEKPEINPKVRLCEKKVLKWPEYRLYFFNFNAFPTLSHRSLYLQIELCNGFSHGPIYKYTCDTVRN